MKRWCWINPRAFLLLHAEALAEHGGLVGLRNSSGLDAALARPQHLAAYDPKADLAKLAASYGFGVARNHPFIDGNKRAFFLAVGLFLSLNGFVLEVEQTEATKTMVALAAGKLSEEELANWIREHLARTS